MSKPSKAVCQHFYDFMKKHGILEDVLLKEVK